MRLVHAIPALPVRDTSQSALFYRDKLGCAIWHEDAGFAIVGRDAFELHLWQASDEGWNGRAGQPVQSGAESFLAGTASCRVEVDGVDDLHAELEPRGVLHPNGPLADSDWGTREFAILDLDGNLVTFFQRVASPSRMDGPESPEALYAGLLETWNRRDAAAYGALFASDGNVVGFDGSQIDGSAAVADEIGRIFRDHQTARYLGKVREVRMIAPGVALLRAVVSMVPPGENSINPAVNAIQSLVVVRDAGAWRAALFHNTPAQFHGRPELAEQLTEELRAELAGSDQGIGDRG